MNLLTIVAMFARNLALLTIFNPSAGSLAVAPIAVMAVTGAAFIWWWRRSTVVLPDLKLGSPISVRQVATFGALFPGSGNRH